MCLSWASILDFLPVINSISTLQDYCSPNLLKLSLVWLTIVGLIFFRAANLPATTFLCDWTGISIDSEDYKQKTEDFNK